MSEHLSVVDKESPVVAQSEVPNLLSVIANAATDPRVDVEKMERLLAMYKEVAKENQRNAFKAALARLQPKIPPIEKNGRIVVKGTERSRYARIEDIDKVIKPLLQEEGFSISYNTDSKDGKIFTISCELSHREGYSETKSLLLPMDASDFRTDVQSIGSTLSYGKRQLLMMHLNIVPKGEDDDGAGGLRPISDDQARDLEAKLSEVGANREGFLKFMGVEKLSDILLRDWKKALNALEAKRRSR